MAEVDTIKDWLTRRGDRRLLVDALPQRYGSSAIFLEWGPVMEFSPVMEVFKGSAVFVQRELESRMTFAIPSGKIEIRNGW